MKNRLDQDQIAMIIADWQQGELTYCKSEISCNNCALNKIIGLEEVGITICDVLVEASEVLNEKE